MFISSGLCTNIGTWTLWAVVVLQAGRQITACSQSCTPGKQTISPNYVNWTIRDTVHHLTNDDLVSKCAKLLGFLLVSSMNTNANACP